MEPMIRERRLDAAEMQLDAAAQELWLLGRDLDELVARVRETVTDYAAETERSNT